ncbi:unnamed protein product [Gordionus sp. m RMFG-2023]
MQDHTIEQCKSHIGNMFTPCQPLVTQNMQPVNAISSNICAPSQLSVANYQTTITSNMFTPCQPLVTQNMEPANAISSNICAPSQLSVANYQTTITSNMFTPCQPLVTQNMQPTNARSSIILTQSQLLPAFNIQPTISSTEDVNNAQMLLELQYASIQNSNIQYIKSSKGNYCLYYQGFLYIRDYCRKDSIYYKCRQNLCNGHVILRIQDSRVDIKREHTHEEDKDEFLGLETRNSLKTAMQANPLESRKTIYNRILTERLHNTPDISDFPNAIPPFESVQKTMIRMIKQSRPAFPLTTGTDFIYDYNFLTKNKIYLLIELCATL